MEEVTIDAGVDSFESMELPEGLVSSLVSMGFDKPTPVQSQSIPRAMEGRDILGSAHTGTGKTAAFGIPLIAHLMTHPNSCALVMTPTRELATQVTKQLRDIIGKARSIKTAVLIGGEPIYRQFKQLDQKPRLLVGTPGRINDHLSRGKISLRGTDFLVLDETDRMMDMGFSVQIEDIMSFMPEKRQTLLFSATLPKNIIRMSDKYLNNPVRVSIGEVSSPANNIKQDVIKVTEEDKYSNLVAQLHSRDGSIIIFVNTKFGADKVAEKLSRDGHSANAIHGDLRQSRREGLLASFRKKRYRILVATDVASRGLDIPHIEHVINYDLPQCPEDYIHRIGRTARAGAGGEALCLVTPADSFKWRAIDRLLNPSNYKDHPKENFGGKNFGNKGRAKVGYKGGNGGNRSGGKSFSFRSKFDGDKSDFGGGGGNSRGGKPAEKRVGSSSSYKAFGNSSSGSFEKQFSKKKHGGNFSRVRSKKPSNVA